EPSAGPAPGYLDRELGARGYVQLGEDVRQVRLHGPARDVQALADLRIGQPLGDQVRDRMLDRGDAVPAGPRPAPPAPAAAAPARLTRRGPGRGRRRAVRSPRPPGRAAGGPVRPDRAGPGTCPRPRTPSPATRDAT